LKQLADRCDLLHVVAHSMGAIVVRLAMRGERLPHLGRLVLIAPPNRGTPVARLFGPLLRPVCPAVAELSNSADSFVNQIGACDGLQVGVIAARYDLTVPRSSTLLDGQTDHICLAGTHNSLLFQQTTAAQVHAFLSTGRFNAGPKAGQQQQGR
jgi:pimeloyl-ACP methyl ester carboxylesterase